MAIVRMQKLHLISARAQREQLLTKLMMLGCVELREQSALLTDERTARIVSREQSSMSDIRADKALFAEAIKLLDKYAPDPPPLLSAKPIVDKGRFFDDERLDASRGIAEKIVALDEEIRQFYLEETGCSTLTEILNPWMGLDMPIEYSGTANVGIKLGTIPTVTDIDAFRAEVADKISEAEIGEVFSDEHTRFLYIIYHRGREEALAELLPHYGFAVPPFGNTTGTAKENIQQLEERHRQILLERALRETHLKSYAPDRRRLQEGFDLLTTREAKAEAMERLMSAGSIVCMDAWVTEPEIPAVTELLEEYDCAYMFEEPAEEEYPSVPVKLRNNRFTDGLNMVTNMYSLPQYGTVDPNPLMAPFFILFYGIMMADMAYGLIMIAAALVAMKRIRPRDGTLSFCRLLFWGGISTFVMGAITGGFFGDAPYQLVHMLNPDSTWQGLPSLFSPLNDSIYVLIGAIVLGFIHLNTGLVVSFVCKVKAGQLIDGLFSEGALWLIFIGAGLAVLGVGSIAGIPVVLCIGVLVLLYGATRGKKGIGKLTAVFGELYNQLTGWFGDLLSYSRIMALMLAGSVISQVFNTIAAMFGNIILFIIVFIIGHVLNFGLNLLGCYVHDLRLQCLEFFGKFYVDGGKAFEPLKIKSKYVEVSK